MSRRDTLRAIVDAGIRAAMPAPAIGRHVRLDGSRLVVTGAGPELDLDLERFKRIRLLGAGKASAAMALALEEMLGDLLTDGLVVTKYEHGLGLEKTRVLEAAHPVPDLSGVIGSGEMLAMARDCGEDDLAICLISGGASALTPSPVDGVSLEDKQRTTGKLLACGATIHEINTIRKHLSRIKGGHLARALVPATVVCLIISDVLGDDLDVIGSGMTAPDSSSFMDCLDIVKQYGLRAELPDSVIAHLEKGMAGEHPETARPGEACFARLTNHIVSGNGQALEAAAEAARDRGYAPCVVDRSMSGEARVVAERLAEIAVRVARKGSPVQAPACLLAGGETTVAIRGKGRGGRNQEMALAMALHLKGWPEARQRIHAACAGTDGTDGPTDAAGALALPDTVERAKARSLDAPAMLDDNDSYSFFSALGDLIITGPTLTNVMDLVVVLVE